MLALAKRVYEWRKSERKCEFDYRLLDRIGSKSLGEWALETTFYDEYTIELGDANHRYSFWEWLVYQRVEFNLQFTEAVPEPKLQLRPVEPVRQKDILDRFKKIVIDQIREYINEKASAELGPETKQAILTNTTVIEGELETMDLPLDRLPLELIRLTRLIFTSVYTEVPMNMREMRAKDKEVTLLATQYIGIAAGIASDFEQQVSENKEIERANVLAEESHRVQHAHWMDTVDFLDVNDRKIDHLSMLLDKWFAYEPFRPFRLELFSWTPQQQAALAVFKENPQCVHEVVNWPHVRDILSFNVRYSKKEKIRLDHRLYDLICGRTVDCHKDRISDDVFEDPFVVISMEEHKAGMTYDGMIRAIIQHFRLGLAVNVTHDTYEDAVESISELRTIHGLRVNNEADRAKRSEAFEDFSNSLLREGVGETTQANTEIKERNLRVLKEIPKWRRLQLVSMWL